MENRIEALKAKHAKELAELEREESIRAQLPVKPDTARIMFHGGKPYVYYKPDSLAGALAILRAFDTVPFSQVRGTFLVHRPMEWISERDREGAKSIVDGCAVMLTIAGGKGFGPSAEFTKWTRLESGELAQVQVEIGGYPGFPLRWHVRSDVGYNRHGDITRVEHTAPGIVADLPRVNWSAGRDDSYRFSWVWQDQSRFEVEAARAILKESTP